jgi:hypothetical protein
MVRKSDLKLDQDTVKIYRRAVIDHLMRQTGGPTPDPRDALRLAKIHYGLVLRQALLGRFTARICRIENGAWALDFNPATRKRDLVAAIWHELSELLCLSDDIVSFEGFTFSSYRDSATTPLDLRHICAVGIERFVYRKLMEFPSEQFSLKEDRVRRMLMARAATASSEPVLPEIQREKWYEDECASETALFVL